MKKTLAAEPFKKQLEAAEEELQAMRSKVRHFQLQYNKARFADFRQEWEGKFICYENGGPDLIYYGRVVGVSKEEDHLEVMEVRLDNRYLWVELQKMPWSLDTFKHRKARILTPKEEFAFGRMFQTYLQINLLDLGFNCNIKKKNPGRRKK